MVGFHSYTAYSKNNPQLMTYWYFLFASIGNPPLNCYFWCIVTKHKFHWLICFPNNFLTLCDVGIYHTLLLCNALNLASIEKPGHFISVCTTIYRKKRVVFGIIVVVRKMATYIEMKTATTATQEADHLASAAIIAGNQVMWETIETVI